MKFKKESACSRPQAAMLCAIAIVVLMFAKGAFASEPVEKVIYNFFGQGDATMPMAGLVADGAGNLYGTSLAGGDSTCGCGSVFELSPRALPGGAWTESVIYSFQGDSTDGRSPYGTLIIDKLGKFYGTTSGGGDVVQRHGVQPCDCAVGFPEMTVAESYYQRHSASQPGN